MPNSPKLTLVSLRLVATSLLVAPMNTVSAEPAGILWMECREHVISLRVDPAPFEEVVGAEFKLDLADGKALVAILVQSCPQTLFDGVDLGPSEQVHMWVRLDVFRDQLPLMGVERMLPAMTWFSLFNGVQNSRLRESFSTAGALSEPIEAVTLSIAAQELNGSVTVSPGMRFAWQGQPNDPFADFVGVNHDSYARNSEGEFVLHRGQAVAHLSTWGGDAILSVEGGTDPHRFIGPGTYAVSVNVMQRVRARASLGNPPE